ncbi:DUF3343 domain-containing protein [Zhaonella formicivorans]|jgi:hypothetical protein|uniref:DUF3343 domain-containing protein n=1 Tax=Zhaonella formicivorans TaxID=2528593 RepID=UPI0010E8A063|nr:DUF3343 domain-containing protein [Zhaonella formicivorans]
MQYCVATFHSVYDSLNFEKAMKTRGIEVKLIPVPREISSSCGTAARFALKDREIITAIAAKEHLEIDRIYTLEEKLKKKSLLNIFS